mmetsp:Transcript_47115/g.135739  ORF Transcript_47115/g.135739 Transcript_47115/m.135739 type:complete len:691 (+) Transcript_47115:108-2180(+)|eukprot:CAMPEP_0176109296 /NCGR_PEP_ID=MMETSP0120_2-20121206/54872_1 /TAXON_ID=160619 /ORGANISM="Kryptoperidinium foliaceum, Strain CCMP 1326" /LENGTH=690 /DNA_ID=CAMNT_0017443477 /DNA_START=44 /DNA_END=2116 /DNA_ORIENTATION=+
MVAAAAENLGLISPKAEMAEEEREFLRKEARDTLVCSVPGGCLARALVRTTSKVDNIAGPEGFLPLLEKPQLTPPGAASGHRLRAPPTRSASTPLLNSPGGLRRLRTSCARWADAFDKLDGDQDGQVNFQEAVKAFKEICGGANSDVPQLKLKALFDRSGGTQPPETVDFFKFHAIVKVASEWMSDNPSWRDLEHKAEVEELALAREMRERKRQESLDLFNILGVRKPPDVRETELRKSAIVRSESMPRLCVAGAAVMESPKIVRRSRVAMQPKRATVADTMSKRSATQFMQAASTGHDRGRHFRDPIFNRVKTIDVATDIRELQVRGYGSACFALRFSPDGSRLAGGYFDGSLRVFDADSKSQISTLNMARPHVNAMILPDMPSHKKDALKMPQDDAIMNLRWYPSTRNLLVGLVDIIGNIGFWDLSKGRAPNLVAKLPGTSELTAMAFNDDRSRLVVGGHERVIKLWEFRDGGAAISLSRTIGEQTSMLAKVSGHSAKIVSLCSDPMCPEVVISGGMDHRALLWDLRRGQGPAAVIQGVELAGDSLDISTDGKTLLAGNHRSRRPLQFFDLRQVGGEAIGPTQSYSWSGVSCGSDDMHDSGSSDMSCLVFSASWDKSHSCVIAAAGEKDGLGQVFRRRQDDTESLEVVSAVRAKSCGAIYSACVSEDGRTAAFGAADGAVQICDLRGV